MDGTYYRVMPDAVWAPLYDNDVFINGDGCVNAVRIRDGHADFKSRYVRTEKFCIERAARQAVFGRYRNRHTDDPRVRHRVHSTANTHVVPWAGQLLALKEDSRPYAVDPDSLETLGYFDFGGRYTAPTHTAHPKVHPATGEMATMGYQARGDGSPDVAYFLFDRHGRKLEECWFKTPYCGMMHDMAATDKWVIFPMPPQRASSPDELARGDKAFAWDDDLPLVFGLLPRRNPRPRGHPLVPLQERLLRPRRQRLRRRRRLRVPGRAADVRQQGSYRPLPFVLPRAPRSSAPRSSGSSRPRRATPSTTSSSSSRTTCGGGSTPTPPTCTSSRWRCWSTSRARCHA